MFGRGLPSAGVSSDNVAHRFGRGGVLIDVVSPDGLGERADLRTLGSATAIEVRGGTSALQFTEQFPEAADSLWRPVCLCEGDVGAMSMVASPL